MKSSELESTKTYYGNRAIKKIREEGYPISLFVQAGPIKVEWIEPSLEKHERFDALIGLENSVERTLDVTFIKDGQFDLFRGLHLERFGTAPVNGVAKEDLVLAVNANRPIDGAAVKAEDAIEDCVKKIERRFSEKVAAHPIADILLLAIDEVGKGRAAKIAGRVFLVNRSAYSEIFLINVFSKDCVRL